MRTIYNHYIRPDHIPHGQVSENIGKLCVWALSWFPILEIYQDGESDMLAIYRKAPNTKAAYTIGVVWRESSGKFTWHS